MTILAQDILAPEHFSTWIFWHLAKQYGRFGTHFGTCANVPKRPPSDMFRGRKSLMPNIPCAKNFPCPNIPVLQRQLDGTSAAPNGACDNMFPL